METIPIVRFLLILFNRINWKIIGKMFGGFRYFLYLCSINQGDKE